MLAANRYVREWRQPQGLIDSITVSLGSDPYGQGALGMGRHRDEGPITREDADDLIAFTPHIQRAIRIGRPIDTISARTADLQALVQSLKFPVVFVARDLTVPVERISPPH